MMKSDLKIKLKVTPEQSREIEDHIRNRDQAAISHAKVPVEGDKPEKNQPLAPPKCQPSVSKGTAVDVGMKSDLKIKLKLTPEQSREIEDYIRNRDQAAISHAELTGAKELECGDRPEQKERKSLPQAGSHKSERFPSADDVSYSAKNQSGAAAECHLSSPSKRSDDLKKCAKQAEGNAAKKIDGGDKPELKHTKSLPEARSHKSERMRPSSHDVSYSGTLKNCDERKHAKESVEGDKPERNQPLAPPKCQPSVSKGTAVDVRTSSDCSKVFIIYDKEMKRHRPLGMDDTENAKRIPWILAKLKEKGLLERCGVSSKATPVDENHVLQVHSENYIEFIKKLPLRGKELKPYYEYLSDDLEEREDFVSSTGTPLAVFLAAGAVVEACCQVATGKYRSSFALVRPPGHHAGHSKANGFCFFNNIAIGARYLQRVHNAKKILVLDIDVHHGDGTQEIFYQDDTVLFCSIHRDRIFPIHSESKCSDIGKGKGKAINDPLGLSYVTPDCFGELIRKIKTISNGKLVLALEGGYDRDSLANSCVACVAELLNNEVTTNGDKCSLKNLHVGTLKAIHEVKCALVDYWPVLNEVALEE